MQRSDRAIEAAIAAAEAQTGVQGTRSRIPQAMSKVPYKARRWTPDEEDFLRQNLCKLPLEEIARRLNRSLFSLLIRKKRELNLTAPSKSKDILTAEHVAMGLGLDSKSVHRLMDRGLMPVRRMPNARRIRVIDRLVFMQWLLNPEHWCYFKAEHLGSVRSRGGRGYTKVYDDLFWEQAREVYHKARRRWKDAWLTPRQAARAIGLKKDRSEHNVNAAIRAGNLKATRWGNWWIRRSELPKRGLKFNALGAVVDKIYPQGKNPKATAIIKKWWRGKKRQWPGGPAKTGKV